MPAMSLADFIRQNRQWGNLQQIASDELLGSGYQAFLQANEAGTRRDFQYWLANQQLNARNEDRTLLNNLLGIGSGQQGPGTGWAFGNNTLFNQNMADIQGMGQGEINRINNQFTDLGNSIGAGLNARGLGGSNLIGAAQSGVLRDKQQALLDVNDRLAGLRVNARSEESQRQTGLVQQLLGQLGNFDLNFDFGGA